MFGHTGMCPFGVIPPRTSLRQGPKWDGGHNLLLFLVSLKSSPWQWQGFQQDDRHNDSPEWLCYKSLTHPKCTKSHLQWSRFQKIFPGGETLGPPLLRGRFAAGEGGKGRGCGGTRKVVCPWARAGSRRAWRCIRSFPDGAYTPLCACSDLTSSSFLSCNSRLRSAIRRHHPPQRAVLT